MFLDEMDPSFQGWFGGCGAVMNCTGMENILIMDQTGSFLGGKYSAISMNEFIGDSIQMRDKCTANTFWNGYNCTRDDFAIMEW
jgi:hypothetical protein